jgi:multidrug resistance efflux pump
MKQNLGRTIFTLLLVTGAVAGIYVATANRSVSATGVPAKERIKPETPEVVVACPGRLEGRSRTIAVGAAIDGVLDSIHVREGQKVSRGDVLAEIGCSDLKTALEVAKAEAESLQQARVRLLRGSRAEERQAAAQKTAAARAVLEQAATQAERLRKLWDAAAISKVAYDEARRDHEVAAANLKEAMRHEELVNAGPLEEEVARADADIRAAIQRIELANDRLSKCVVRAPISGTVLRAFMREGESFALLAPKPLFSLADDSGRRVRAEVDERDIGKVRAGQAVVVTSDAYPDRKFAGKVAELAHIMGRKSVVTGDPGDKSDRDVLEVLAELDSEAAALPLGLRVTVQFLP